MCGYRKTNLTCDKLFPTFQICEVLSIPCNMEGLEESKVLCGIPCIKESLKKICEPACTQGGEGVRDHLNIASYSKFVRLQARVREQYLEIQSTHPALPTSLRDFQVPGNILIFCYVATELSVLPL